MKRLSWGSRAEHRNAEKTAALCLGRRVFLGSVGGVGGCPYAPGAAGNVATEAVARHLAALGYETGLDLDVIDEAAALAKAMRAG